MKTHRLKTWPGPFEAIRKGTKRHEYRVNDRAFDALTLGQLQRVGGG